MLSRFCHYQTNIDLIASLTFYQINKATFSRSLSKQRRGFHAGQMIKESYGIRDQERESEVNRLCPREATVPAT